MHLELAAAGQAEALGFSPALDGEYAVPDEGLRVAGRKAAPLGRMQDANTRYGPSDRDASRDCGGVFDFGEFGHGKRCCVLIAACCGDACWCWVNQMKTKIFTG
jgi:hypothetical protein